jgi:methyl-accepting chemotaxis protein
VAVLIGAAAVAMFLSFYVSRLISKPLQPLSAFMKKAGTVGDLTLTQEDIDLVNKYAHVKDEI